MRGDLLEALFYAPEVNSPSYRARSVGFCALRLGAECTTPVDRMLCAPELSVLHQWTECSASGSRVLCAREPSVLQLGGGGFQGVVEVLAKCIYEGSLEELIDGDAFSFSLCKGAAAERPAVKV